MSKIKTSDRKTDIRVLASIECNRMRREGFIIPKLHIREIDIREGMTRKELRKVIAKDTTFYTVDGYEVPGEIALSIMESSVGKRDVRETE